MFEIFHKMHPLNKFHARLKAGLVFCFEYGECERLLSIKRNGVPVRHPGACETGRLSDKILKFSDLGACERS